MDSVCQYGRTRKDLFGQNSGLGFFVVCHLDQQLSAGSLTTGQVWRGQVRYGVMGSAPGLRRDH